MSPRQIAALFRRHLAAVAVVFLVTAGLGYHLKHADPGYTDVATVAFTAPKFQPNLFAYGQSLLVMDELAVSSMTTVHSQQQVRMAGGTAHYDVALVNLNTEDFPNYSDPYLTVTTTSADPVAAQTTFSAVMKVLQHNVAAMQSVQGAKLGTWIGMNTIAAPTGPVAQTGSAKRSYAGLLLLAIIAAFMISKLLDRYPIRLRNLFQRPDRQYAPGRAPITTRFRPRAD